MRYKKSSGILCKRPRERIRFAKEELSEFYPTIVCKGLNMSRSGVYQTVKLKERKKEFKNLYSMLKTVLIILGMSIQA